VSRRPGFEALAPFFQIIAEGLSGLVDGEGFFDTLAEDTVFEYVVSVPGYPRRVVGRSRRGAVRDYGQTIVLHGCDELAERLSPDASDSPGRLTAEDARFRQTCQSAARPTRACSSSARSTVGIWCQADLDPAGLRTVPGADRLRSPLTARQPHRWGQIIQLRGPGGRALEGNPATSRADATTGLSWPYP